MKFKTLFCSFETDSTIGNILGALLVIGLIIGLVYLGWNCADYILNWIGAPYENKIFMQVFLTVVVIGIIGKLWD
jgi:hypothetical protein